jgi:hypothetical protein
LKRRKEDEQKRIQEGKRRDEDDFINMSKCREKTEKLQNFMRKKIQAICARLIGSNND